MATRAFVLCADEKAVHAVAQILDELEVSFEHSGEPPFALKRLAAQRFDLLIVDCDNAQNATQVFNSARASSLNKNSIGVAIVEGKAGVPNAFRLGASLVLTKPVSLEQSRNALRTGIGMAKKDTPDTKAPAVPVPAVTTALTTPVSAPLPAPATPPVTAPVNAPPTPVLTPVVAAPKPAPAPVVPMPAVPAPATQGLVVAPRPEIAAKPVAATPAAEKTSLVPRPVSVPALPTLEVKKELKPAVTSAIEPKAQTSSVPPILAKAATAAAGAAANPKSEGAMAAIGVKNGETPSKGSIKKTSSTEQESKPPLRIEDPLANEEHAFDPMKDHGVPTFGGMGKQVFGEVAEPKKNKRGKGFLIAALVLLVLGGGAYAAWMTQPAFRNMLLWEYEKAQDKIAEWRGQPSETVAKAQAAAPAVVPPPAAPYPTSSDANLATNGNPDSTSAASANLPTSATTGAAGQASAPATSAAAQPSVQGATQDTTPGHRAANPALVPASLPPTTAQKSASDLLEVPEDFADDEVVHRVHPVYPKQARGKRLHGTVVLQAVVNKKGQVKALQLISGDPVLAQAAADAVKQWRYKPYSHEGEPVDFQTRVSVDFKLP